MPAKDLESQRIPSPPVAAEEPSRIWSFDLGKASIGEAVRIGTEFKHKESLLIPEAFAETKTARSRRRMWRTRQAHKAREAWLDQVMSAAGVQPLRGRRIQRNAITRKWETTSGDERLEREFASSGDPTCYTSCLLRIKLLRGETLEPWQIYKALRSAIQRRGYDPNIPWRTREQRSTTKPEGDEEGHTRTRMQEFERQLEEMAPGKRDYQWPCYFDAWKMGLWNPDKPDELRRRQDCLAHSTRNQIVPRKLVEAEVRALMESAARQIPVLRGKADYLLFGPTERPYASFYPEERKRHKIREGGPSDWQGVVGQKIPRFDNRIVEKCILIPRLNVCKGSVRINEKTGKPFPETQLPSEVTFLMKLKNMRFQQGSGVRGLTPKEISDIFNDPKRAKLGLTKTQWRKRCEQLGGQPMPGQFEEVAEPTLAGRSRFCRPTLEILKRLILSGNTPRASFEKEMARLNGNTNPLKGLVVADIEFLLEMGPTWEGVYIPNQKLDAFARATGDPQDAIRQLIGSQNDPIVRHRLSLFLDRLNDLAAKFGTPDCVVLEFVRTDFMGSKAKQEFEAFQRQRAKDRSIARKEAAEAGAAERSAGLKMELLKAQVGECLYRPQDKLIPEKLDEYVIDHIVPRAKGGPDAAVNYVLTTRRTNDEKADRTPYEWLGGQEGWNAYVERTKKRLATLRNKKVQLLTSPDAETLVQKYTALAETAWISKLAQTIVGLRFGWPGGVADGKRKITIVSGGLTGRIRRKYKLNSLLNPGAETEEEAEQKNRDDDRHHALDAMVISFIPNWARNDKLTGFFRFPNGVHREFFAKEIAEVVPKAVCFEQPSLAETIYGIRSDYDKKVIVQRAHLVSLGMKPTGPGKSVFDLKYAGKQVQSIRDNEIQRRLVEFLTTVPDESAWRRFCHGFRLKQKDGRDGPLVEYVTVTVGEPTEYKDLSKDGTGAYRRAFKRHKGQIIFLDGKGKPRVRPVYAFESLRSAQSQLLADVPACMLKGFFQSGCLVALSATVPHSKTPLSPGKYSLKTIRSDGFVVLTNPSGQDSQPIGVAKLLSAGFRRVE